MFIILEDFESLNAEGRVVLTEHVDTESNHVVVMNLYCPRAELDNKERTKFKLKFYSLVEKKCKALLQENKWVELKKCALTIWEHNFHLTKCLFFVFFIGTSLYWVTSMSPIN
jgi:hypothetical protein